MTLLLCRKIMALWSLAKGEVTWGLVKGWSLQVGSSLLAEAKNLKLFKAEKFFWLAQDL